MTFFIQYLLILLVVIIPIIRTTVKVVPQSEQWTVERFGRFTHILHPGLNFIMPFADRIGTKISMRERVLDVPPQDVITQDNAVVRVDGVIFFRIFDSVKAAYEVGNLKSAITYLTMTTLRTVMGEMPLDNMLTSRVELNAKLLGIVDLATDPWGVKITRVEIKEITPSRELTDSMENQTKAERDKRANILNAESHRQAAILRAEGDRKAAILVAEGNKEATILQAQANKEARLCEAEARERMGEAEAHATKSVAQAIKGEGQQAVNYFVAQKYIESLKSVGAAENSKVVFMPLDATNVMGAMGGMTELWKNLNNKKNKDSAVKDK